MSRDNIHSDRNSNCRKMRTFFSCNLGPYSWRKCTCIKLEIHQLFNMGTCWHYTPKPPSVTLCSWENIRFLVRAECWGLRKRQTRTCDILPLAFLVLAFQWTKEGGRRCRGKRKSEGIGREGVERWMGKGSQERNEGRKTVTRQRSRW